MGGGGTKNLQNFSIQANKHLHIEIEMKAKWCCCQGQMWAETRDNAVTSGLLSSTIEKLDLHKNDKCLIAAHNSQQFMVKCGVMILHVSQLSGEKPSGCQWPLTFAA
jgi:hypothetical protein